MTFDNGLYLLGTLGSELPLSANDATLASPVEDLTKDIRLAGGQFKRYRSASPMKHWQFSYAYLPGKREYVYDGGLSRNDLWVLYTADAEMSFAEPNDQGIWQWYTVRFVANSWVQQVVFRSGDFWAWRVNFELLQTQTGPFAMNYNAVILRETALQRYHRLGEASGTTAVDSSANGAGGVYSGTVGYGAPGALSGDPNTAITFNGTTTEMLGPALNLAGSPLSLEAWFNANDVASAHTVASLFSGNVAGQAHSLNINTSKIKLNDGASALTSVTTLTTGQWYYLVVTQSPTGLFQIYINGQFDTSGALTPLNVNNTVLSIGCRGDSVNFFNGVADEVAVYNRVLSAADVARHYTAAPVNLVGV